MTTQDALHIQPDDLIQYALGNLKESQLGTMTAHISMCNVCRGELGKIQVELASFAAVQPETELPAGARERFMSKLQQSPSAQSKFVQARDRNRFYIMTKSLQGWIESAVPVRILAGALAVAVIILAYDDLDHVHEVRQMVPALKRAERDTAQLAELKNFLHGSNIQQVTLHQKPNVDKVPEGHTLYSSTTGELVFTASNMQTPPEGKTYELWLLPAGGGKPIPAGTFVPDLQGNGAIVFPELAENVQAAGFGITVENEGGATTPTLPIILSGQ
jgi:anti-sigma-K factor RskA